MLLTLLIYFVMIKPYILKLDVACIEISHAIVPAACIHVPSIETSYVVCVIYVFHCSPSHIVCPRVQSLFEQVNHGVVCLTMEVIGAYVSWIDISLIANDKCMRYDTFPAHASMNPRDIHVITSVIC